MFDVRKVLAEMVAGEELDRASSLERHQPDAVDLPLEQPVRSDDPILR